MTGPSRDVYVSTKCQDGDCRECPLYRKSNRVRCSCPRCDHRQALGPPATTVWEDAPSRVGYLYLGTTFGVRRDLIDTVARGLRPRWNTPSRWGLLLPASRRRAGWLAAYLMLSSQGAVPPAPEGAGPAGSVTR